MRLVRSALVAFLVAAVPAFAALPAKGKGADSKTRTATVSRWLVLGPVPCPLPVFHDAKAGGYTLEDLLKADLFPRGALSPSAGRAEAWPGGDRPPVWTERQAGDSGRVELDRGDAPRVAWLAAFVETDRFRSIDLELTGAHPRRAWLDGEGVVLGGLATEGAGAEAKGTLKLAPGKHTLVLETVFDVSRKDRWSAGAVLSSAGDLDGLAIGADPRRPLGILDVLDAPQVASLAASPDGTTVAIEWTRIVPGTDDAESWIELRALDDGRIVQTRRGGTAIGQVAFAPGGKRWSYVTKDKAEADKDLSTLWVADLTTGAVEPVLERAENLASYAWSPAGDAIVFAATIKPEPDKRGLKLHQGLLDKRAGHRDRTVLGIVSVPGGTRRRIIAGDLSASVESFSPDGRRLLVRRQREALDRRPFTMDELWEVDLATLASKKLLESGWVQGATFAPDGRRILVLSGPSEFGGIGIETPEGVTPNESQGELYVWDPPSGAATCITKGFDPSISDAYWSPFDGNVYFRATDADTVRLFRWSQFSKRIDRLDTGGDVMQEWAFARFAPVAVVSATSPWTPEAVHVVDLASGSARKIAGPPDAWFESVTRGTVEPMRFTSSEGTPIDGRVYLPPGFDPKRTGGYPAIVFYYGGILPVTRDFGGRYPKEWWAARGYVVYVPQPSGAMGYGQAFAARHVNDWGATTTGEILEGTRKFLDAYPAVDRKRVGGIGASYGGFMTMVLAAKSDLFAAFVSHAGISSLASYWGEGYWGYSYSGVATADSFPWNRKDIYVERSPLFFADKVKTPILLTHGASDTNVPVGESESFYTALKLLGAQAEFVEVAGQDHWILDHAKRIVWSKTIVAWFDRWLKGRPEWWNELYPAPK